MKKRSFGIAEWLLAGLALICLILAFCPFDAYKTFGDRMSPDGNMERITPELILILRVCLTILFLFILGMVLWSVFYPENKKRFFRSLALLPRRCFQGIKPFFRDLSGSFRMSRMELIILLLIFLAGTVLRAMQLKVPLRYDESYTMVMWGRSDLFYAVSNYHLPNNHVFHTIWVNLIFHLIGKSPLLLRLPAFISGCLLIPSVWLLGKTFYNRLIGLLAAGFTAFAPYLVYYSVNARGYEIMVLFSVLAVGLAVYSKRKNNIFSWFLLILFSGLSFYTLPISLYPFGGICIWLLLNVIFFEEDSVWRSRWQLFKYLIFMGLSVSILTFVLYLPIFLCSGFKSFFGNGFVQAREFSEFWQTLASRMKDNVKAFSGSLPSIVLWCIGLGIILSVILFRYHSKEKVSYGLSVFLWLALLIPIQRPELMPRVLIFLHPFLLLFAASGLSGLHEIPHFEKVSGWLFAVLVLVMGVSQFNDAKNVVGVIGSNERAVQVIKEREGANVNNILLVTGPGDDAPNWAYAEIYDLPETIFDKRVAFNTVYVYVNPLDISDFGREPKTLDEMLAKYGPGDNFIIRKSAEIVMEEPDCILYRLDVRESAIRKAYGDYPEISD